MEPARHELHQSKSHRLRAKILPRLLSHLKHNSRAKDLIWGECVLMRPIIRLCKDRNHLPLSLPSSRLFNHQVPLRKNQKKVSQLQVEPHNQTTLSATSALIQQKSQLWQNVVTCTAGPASICGCSNHEKLWSVQFANLASALSQSFRSTLAKIMKIQGKSSIQSFSHQHHVIFITIGRNSRSRVYLTDPKALARSLNQIGSGQACSATQATTWVASSWALAFSRHCSR